MTVLLVATGGWNAVSRSPDGPRGSVIRRGLDATVDLDALDAGAAAAPRIDLYGNEVETAIGDYRIDVRGDLYERHSPETEVTQLAAPSS